MSSRRLACAVGFALGGILLPHAASAQQGQGPIVFGRQDKKQALKLENFQASAEFKYRRETDSLEPRDSPKFESTEDRFEELLNLSSTGYMVHPNLVDLSLAGQFGLAQDTFQTGGQSDAADETLYAWDASATMLRNSDTPLTLYSRRTRDTVNRQFGPSLDSTITTTGGTLDWRSKVLPTRIEAYHMDQEQTSLQATDNYTLAQDTFTWHSEYQPSSRHHLTWDYTFNRMSQTSASQGGQEFFSGSAGEFDTHDATLTHSVDFGPKDANTLTSTLNYFNQTGQLSLERLQWMETLRLKHTDHLETHYLYTLDQQSFSQEPLGSSDQTRQRGQATFIHRLYKSLITTGNAGVQTLDTNDGNSFETFAGLTFDYHKQVPLGTLSALLGFNYNQQENDSRSFQVVTASQTFPTDAGERSIVLVGQNIDPNSIILRDISGMTLRPGHDYAVDDTVPGQVTITRLFGGSIDPGETVQLSYALEPQAANTTTTTGFTLGGRYDIDRGPFKGLSLYSRYTQQDQTIDSDYPTQFVPNSFTDFTAGAGYHIWDLWFGAEMQSHDSTLSPFDATRYYARLAHALSLNTNIAANVAYTTLDYSDPDNTIDILTISGQLQQRFSREFYANATVLWRDENDGQHGTTRGLEEQIELRWSKRQTHVYVQFRNANLDTDEQNSSFQLIEIGIRRDF